MNKKILIPILVILVIIIALFVVLYKTPKVEAPISENISENVIEAEVKEFTMTSFVEFVADQTGTFEYYCNMPGHRANGHVGTLIVLEK